MIELAKLQEQRQMQMPQYRANLANIKPEPNYIDKMKQGIAERAVTGLVNKGEEFATPYIDAGMEKVANALSPAAANVSAPTAEGLIAQGVDRGLAEAAVSQGASGAATSGLMSGIGTAMPYIGAGLLAGKALGFFNRGGPVMAGPLASVKYKTDGGKIKEQVELRYKAPLGG